MNQNKNGNCDARIQDCGPDPFIVNMDCVTEMNSNFRTALWTGEYLQMTLMCIPAGGEIGLEMHDDLDQFIRIEEGCALIKMGKCKNSLDILKRIDSHCGVFVPACTWHNIINTGCTPLKLSSIYAPPKHPFGTVHRTRQQAECAER